LVFRVPAAPAIAASLIDLGERFRLLINKVDVVDQVQDMPHLPVARVMWKPQPNLATAAQAWILAGGAHHTSFSQVVTLDQMETFAEIAGIEMLVIDQNTEIGSFKDSIRWNEVYYRLFEN
jgi:L-arabinose isomerase